jgi:integral membrane sensor domain MASE1
MADPIRVGIAFALSDAAETLTIAGLIGHYFGAAFSLNRLRHVLGMLAAAVIGTSVSGAGGVAASVLLRPPTVSILTIWEHWVASNTIGFIAVAPLLIGLAAALRHRPPRSEFVEGVAALTTLAVMTAIIISLSQERWETVVPVAWLSPMLLWLAARCRPVFAAAGAFIVSIRPSSALVILEIPAFQLKTVFWAPKRVFWLWLSAHTFSPHYLPSGGRPRHVSLRQT